MKYGVYYDDLVRFDLSLLYCFMIECNMVCTMRYMIWYRLDLDLIVLLYDIVPYSVYSEIYDLVQV